ATGPDLVGSSTAPVVFASRQFAGSQQELLTLLEEDLFTLLRHWDFFGGRRRTNALQYVHAKRTTPAKNATQLDPKLAVSSPGLGVRRWE
ncbi:MAG: hypothetical protein ABSB82_14020, partial [Terriglobia bacterium]